MHSLGSSKETFKWIDERIINYELATSACRNSELLSMLLYSSIYPSRSNYYNTDQGGSSYSSSLYEGSNSLRR